MSSRSTLSILLAGATLLGFGGWSLIAALKGAPALNAELREPGLAEDWRTPVAPGLYDLSLYTYQTGYGLVFGDALEDSADLVSAETAAERARRARDLFLKATSVAPADAYAWSGLAWAEALLDRPKESWAALRAAYELAPQNKALAVERLVLVETLIGDEEGELAGLPAAAGVPAEAVCVDLDLAIEQRVVDPGDFLPLIETVSRLCRRSMETSAGG